MVTEAGSNTWKLGELLVLASAGSLVQLLFGFPSYGALVGTLGVGALGAVWSYSNYLKRTAPQITSIHLTKDSRYHIYYS